jgi:hypothetical protein
MAKFIRLLLLREATGYVALKGVKAREVAKDLINPKNWFSELPGILGKALVESLDAVRELHLTNRVVPSGRCCFLAP